MRILRYLQEGAEKRNETLFYMYENTANMDTCNKKRMIKCVIFLKSIILNQILKFFFTIIILINLSKPSSRRDFKAEPIELCASLFVPMRRNRLFFTNIPKSNDATMVNEVPPLEDYLDVGRKATMVLLPTITTNPNSHKRNDKYPVIDEEGEESFLSVNELERLFGLGEGYTDNGFLSTTQRRKLIGKSWCMPVIAHLLKPLQNYYSQQ